jgi:hypothetical protein
MCAHGLPAGTLDPRGGCVTQPGERGCCSNLHHLVLLDRQFPVSSCAAIAQLAPNLTHLDLRAETFGVEYLNGLSVLTKLRCLRVHGTFPCSHCIMQSNITALRRLTSLVLEVWGVTNYLTCEVRATKTLTHLCFYPQFGRPRVSM